MSLYDAVLIAEGVELGETEAEYYEAWQMLVDTGLVWQLQGWFGRTVSNFIEEGLVLPAR